MVGCGVCGRLADGERDGSDVVIKDDQIGSWGC